MTGMIHSPVESTVGLFMRKANGTSKPTRNSAPKIGVWASGASQIRAHTSCCAVSLLPRLKIYQSRPFGSIQSVGSKQRVPSFGSPITSGGVKVFASSLLQLSSTSLSGEGSFGPPVNQDEKTRPFAVRSKPGMPRQVRSGSTRRSAMAWPPKSAESAKKHKKGRRSMIIGW